MDAGVGSEAEVADAYRQLERVNRRLGGYRASLDPLRALLAVGPAAGPGARGGSRGGLSLLDVAGGDGRFAVRLVEELGSPTVPVTAWMLDRSRVSTTIAAGWRSSGGRIVAVRGDALRLPFPDRAVDVVHTAAFLHHLGVDDARVALAEMCRVSRRLVLVNDLVRSWVAAGSIWALTRLLSGNRLISHDGPLSVMKAFRPQELISLARAGGPAAAGFRWRLIRTFPYRMALVGARIDSAA